MELGLDCDKALKDWEDSLLAYQQFTGKAGAVVLNKKGKDVISKAMKYTPAADGGGIRSYLLGPPTRTRGTAIAYALIRHTKKDGTRRSRTREKGKRNSELRSHMLKFVAASVGSRNYIKAGFLKAFGAVGGYVRKLRSGKLADQSYGQKATSARLLVEIVNRTVGAVSVAGPALAKAMDENREDTMEHLRNEIAKGWARRR